MEKLLSHWYNYELKFKQQQQEQQMCGELDSHQNSRYVSFLSTYFLFFFVDDTWFHHRRFVLKFFSIDVELLLDVKIFVAFLNKFLINNLFYNHLILLHFSFLRSFFNFFCCCRCVDVGNRKVFKIYAELLEVIDLCD